MAPDSSGALFLVARPYHPGTYGGLEHQGGARLPHKQTEDS